MKFRLTPQDHVFYDLLAEAGRNVVSAGELLATLNATTTTPGTAIQAIASATAGGTRRQNERPVGTAARPSLPPTDR